MKMKEILALEEQEIDAHIKQKQKELFDLRIKMATNELKNVSELGKTRKTIARLLTYKNMPKQNNK
jgi:ribosomal protein L29